MAKQAWQKAWIWALAVVGMILPATAGAAGFEFGPQGLHAIGRGGAFTAKADDPSAFYWNPGTLALLRGTRLLVNYSLSRLDLTFDRDDQVRMEYGEPTDETVTFDRARQDDGFFPMGVSLGLSSDFGLQDWTFALGMVGPAAYGKSSMVSEGAGDVSTRYAFEKADVLIAYGTLSAAYKYKEWFGIGATLMYGMVPKLKYSMVVIGPGGPTNQNHPSATRSDLRADVDVQDWFSMTAVLGAWVRPVKGLEIGLSSRIVPVPINATGNVRISGASATFAKIDADIPAELKFKLPATFQAGVRYYGLKDGREEWDIEADYVWEQWSGMDAFRLDMKQDVIQQAGMEIALSDLTLTRNYKDTHSVRLGGQWNILDGSFNPVRGLGLTLRLGGWWESAAMPDDYTVADFAAFQRFGIGSGLSIAYRGIEVGLSYGHVFQPDRTVAAGTGRVYQQILTPTGVPMEPTGDGGMPYAVNEGKYSSSFDVIALGITIHWDELIHGYDDAPATDATR